FRSLRADLDAALAGDGEIDGTRGAAAAGAGKAGRQDLDAAGERRQGRGGVLVAVIQDLPVMPVERCGAQQGLGLAPGIAQLRTLSAGGERLLLRLAE